MVKHTDYRRPMKQLLGLGRQFGLKMFGGFVAFSAKLSALFWQGESLVRGKMDLVFRHNTYKSQIYPKSDIWRVEFG